MRKLTKSALTVSAFVLTACSGGGGSNGGPIPTPGPSNPSSYSLDWTESNSGLVSGLPTNLYSISPGTVITLNLSIPSGFKLDQWTGVCAGSTNQCQIIMSDNIIAGVVLSPIFNYLLSLTQPTLGGTIAQTITGTSFEENTSLTLYAVANADNGFKFKNWTGDCASQTANSCSLTFTKDMLVSAEFECVSGKILNGSICEN